MWSTSTGWLKRIVWQVTDHLDQPMLFRLPVADIIVNKPNDCHVGRMGEGTTLSKNFGTDLDDDKNYRYQCNGIQVEGDGSNLTPWEPHPRRKMAMFVDQIFSSGFNDWATDDELLTWTNRLNNGYAQGPGPLLAEARACARAVFDSAEYKNVDRSDEDFITDLYNGYLGREPDPDGLNFWVGTYRNDLAQGSTDMSICCRHSNYRRNSQIWSRYSKPLRCLPNYQLTVDDGVVHVAPPVFAVRKG